MTPTDLTLEALDYIEVTTITGAKAGQLQRIARDLTATLQQIYSIAPALYKDRHGARVAEPQSITVTVAQGLTTLTTVTALVDGSTILVEGDATYNTVRVDGAAKTLTLPYNGLSGTYPATVWNDSIPLATTVDRVTGSAKLNEQFPLEPRRNRDEALTRRILEPDYGRQLRSVVNRPLAGQPDSYWVEAVLGSNGTVAQSRLRFRLHPMPNRSYTVAFDVRKKPPQLSVADLGTDATPSTVPLIVAAGMQESIVRPLFLKRWSGSAWFRNKEAKEEITEEAKEARALLESYRVQQQSRMLRTAPL